jgi:hypothetical protein
MVDDIYWVLAEENQKKSFFFCIDDDPRTISDGVASGKMIYSEALPYGHYSVPYLTQKYGTLYRAVSKIVNGTLVLNDEHSIQSIAKKFGYSPANGLQRNISYIRASQISEIFPSQRFLSRFTSKIATSVAKQVANHYDVSIDTLRISGGAQLNGRDIHEQHDLDIVIPIKDEEHAKRIWVSIRDKDTGQLVENGFKSPMRWMCDDEHMVCPFFVCGENLESPIRSVKELGDYQGELEIIDCRYSILNMPILLTKGDVDFVAFRSRVARSCLNEGQKLQVKGVIVEVIEGGLQGKRGVLITKPFTEVVNLKALMGRWNA